MAQDQNQIVHQWIVTLGACILITAAFFIVFGFFHLSNKEAIIEHRVRLELAEQRIIDLEWELMRQGRQTHAIVKGLSQITNPTPSAAPAPTSAPAIDD